MKNKDIDFLITLIIKLDISIEAEHNNVSADGLMLIFDFTEKNRKESITKALDILNKTQNKWQKLKEWLEEMIKEYEPTYDEWMALNYDFYNKTNIQSVYKNILDKIQELEGEDE